MLAEVVRETSSRFGDRAALATPDGWTCSYRDLDRLSDAVAVWLRDNAGLGVGSVVALAMPTSVEFLVIYAAIAKLGAITAGVNPHLTPAEQRAAVDACQPDALLTDSRATADAMSIDRTFVVELASTIDDVCRAMRVDGEAPAILPVDADRGVAICFTSGSTGQPKGALVRDRQLRSIFELDTGGAWGGGVPSIIGTQFAHVGAMTKVPWMLAGGATLHALRKWRADTAREQAVPAYVILHDKTLRELAEVRPVSHGLLAGITGMGSAKIEHYGAELLELIRNEA